MGNKIFDKRMSDVGLYSFENEHDACGVAYVADLGNKATHKIVRLGVEALERLMHRGASGGDPETGDGAGILVSTPDDFFRKHITNLPPKGEYAVAMVFGDKQAEIEKIAKKDGLQVVAWREVPHNANTIGKAARDTCPKIMQLFVKADGLTGGELDRKIFVTKRKIEKQNPDITFCSFSRTSVVYKGLLQATQITSFYPDLADEDFKSPLALVHQRYSTNTFPTWSLAHPFRYLAHNGEINTLKGNLNHLSSKEKLLKSDLFGDALQECFPLMDGTESDSSSLDRMFELLVLAGRSLPHAMMMLIPQAWGDAYHLSKDIRAFFAYQSALMEPWDGPAAVAFSDGINIGAILDRNGLRPARYTLTDENIFILASESGVVDVPTENVVKRGRLKPGEMVWCDLEKNRLVFDRELKESVARSKPYRRWLDKNQILVRGLFDSVSPHVPTCDLQREFKRFHWSREDVDKIVKGMATSGYEPIGAMGNDSALAVFSKQTPLLYNYFKQLFAQVTNPPIDPIREELVMSLLTYIGNQGNILEETEKHARLIRMPSPVLTDEDLTRLQNVEQEGFEAVTLEMSFERNLACATEKLAEEAVKQVKSGKNILILSDRNIADGKYPIPALLALGAVSKALVKNNLRPPVGLIVSSAEVREVMHFALLLGFGATAVNPYLAFECIQDLCEKGDLKVDQAKAAENYIHAIDKGLLKVMSKMGISTLRSYRGAQIFEAVGLDRSVIDKYFTGTASRIGGLTIEDVEHEIKDRFNKIDENSPLLRSGGEYAYRKDGESHLWTPDTLGLFRQAVQMNDWERYKSYASLINNQGTDICTIRGLFSFKQTKSISVDEVESVDSIVKNFVSGAMSLGSLSPEAHEAIAIAMNNLGAMSNCGEGGEDIERSIPGANGENRSSAIRQIASGRFGVTIDYLAGAKELQIKMAQGAKPGEGGQLPGHKVDENIAKVRHSTPGVTLISPPPHHDIYSIEDLSQLVSDLRLSNKGARVSVKLVSEVGVGTVAAGVAKAAADVVLISGHDGGTGASPLSSIKHAGLPWELGLAEAQQTLVLNNLRSRVRLQVDGQLKTGRDVVVAALLGAEEFGFATTLLVCLGCIMMRKCDDNSCPVGVATQDEELRKCFTGKPEYIENFLRFIAKEARELLAQLGLKSMKEAVGRSDLLQMSEAIEFFKCKNLDFSKIFERAGGYEQAFVEAIKVDPSYDETVVIPKLAKTLETGEKAELNLEIKNVHRSCGTELSGVVAKKFGGAKLDDDTIVLNLSGVAGQSFGAFLAKGITLNLVGEANDFIGKGLSGGKIIVKTPAEAKFDSSKNVIAGNVVGYGATSGKVFLNGLAGERFAIRNSGMTLVVEGGGDHGCEYMTGGMVVVLGEVGMNFGAGMSGGIAYVYDKYGDFDMKCNLDTIDLETVEQGSKSEQELLEQINEYVEATDSRVAKDILANWIEERAKFIKVFPVEYKRILKAKGLI